MQDLFENKRPAEALGRSEAPGEVAPLEAAQALLRVGRAAEAVEVLTKCADRPECRSRLREYLVAERDMEPLHRLLGSPSTDPGVARIDAAVAAHMRRDLATAMSLCADAIAADPRNPWAHNHFGRALFNAGRKTEALAAFKRAVDLDPGYSEAFNGLGHVLRDSGDVDGAEAAFRRAVEGLPAFVEARMNLGVMLLARGDAELALVEFARVLDLRPRNPDAAVNAGSCLHMLRRYAEAQTMYEQAIATAVGRPVLAHRQLGKLLVEQGDTNRALDQQQRALALAPGMPEVHSEYVSTLELANRLDEAWASVNEALARFPGHPVLMFEAAKLERRRGNPGAGLERLRTINPAQIPAHLQQWFYFELGTTLDRLGDAAAAFSAFESSNRLARDGMRARSTDRDAFGRALDAMSDWISIGAPTPASGPGEDLGEDLVFLLGFPRSGTTLLDIMLDGHPDVVCLEERQTMEHVFHEVDSTLGGFPHGLSNASAAQRDALRRHYRRRLADNGVTARPGQLIIDKMPIRTPYVAFMLRLFPQARVLFSVRHPCDVVLSNFMQNYAANEVFVHFYSLQDSARTYARVMDIWQQTTQVLPPNRWHYIRYEELVTDTRGSLKGACEFIGVPFREDLADHRETLGRRERIRTNSYHQVTEALYVRSAGRWKSYREQMAPVVEILRPHVHFFGYELES